MHSNNNQNAFWQKSRPLPRDPTGQWTPVEKDKSLFDRAWIVP